MSYKPPVKDEIPGMTGFLYEANRFREDHEYTNYWKWKRFAEEKAAKHGITDLKLDNLVSEIVRLKQKLEESGNSYAYLEDQYTDLDKEHDDLKHEHKQLKDEMHQVQPQINHLETQLVLWMDATMDFGEHLEDCGWIELIQSGRVVGGKEEDYCSCGWYKKRMDLKRDPRFINSRPKEVIVVKKKSGGSFKINLDID